MIYQQVTMTIVSKAIKHGNDPWANNGGSSLGKSSNYVGSGLFSKPSSGCPEGPLICHQYSVGFPIFPDIPMKYRCYTSIRPHYITDTWIELSDKESFSFLRKLTLGALVRSFVALGGREQSRAWSEQLAGSPKRGFLWDPNGGFLK